MARVGSALTGQEDPSETPLKDIVTGAGSQVYDKLLGDPESRSALLQIGLQMMQRPGFGSGTGEHIAQSIGAGGEAVGRLEESELKRAKVDDALEKARLMYEVSKQRADTYEKKANEQKTDTLSNTLRYRMEQDAFAADEKIRESRAKAIKESVDEYHKNANDRAFQALNKTDTDTLRFTGKSKREIQKIVEAEYDASNPKPPTRAEPVTTPKSAQPTRLPPVSERVAGKTRIPKRDGGFFVWNGTGWEDE